MLWYSLINTIFQLKSWNFCHTQTEYSGTRSSPYVDNIKLTHPPKFSVVLSLVRLQFGFINYWTIWPLFAVMYVFGQGYIFVITWSDKHFMTVLVFFICTPCLVITLCSRDCTTYSLLVGWDHYFRSFGVKFQYNHLVFIMLKISLQPLKLSRETYRSLCIIPPHLDNNWPNSMVLMFSR